MSPLWHILHTSVLSHNLIAIVAYLTVWETLLNSNADYKQNILHCIASKPDVKINLQSKVHIYLEFLFTHKRFCHDDANLAFSLSSKVNKQALQDVFAWFTVWVNVDRQHGWRSFFSLCTRNRWDGWLDISVTNWRSWNVEKTHLLVGNSIHLNFSSGPYTVKAKLGD